MQTYISVAEDNDFATQLDFYTFAIINLVITVKSDDFTNGGMENSFMLL